MQHFNLCRLAFKLGIEFRLLNLSGAGFDLFAAQKRADEAAAVQLAERYIATGAYLKAQRILEKLKREQNTSPRVADLLWALEGEFGLGDVAIARGEPIWQTRSI